MCVQIVELRGFVPVSVVDGAGSSLLGRDIMLKFSFPWKDIFIVAGPISTDDIIR